MKAIVGLGNPGLQYRLSRHNLGFLAIDHLAKRQRIRINKRGLNCLWGQGVIGTESIFLLKPKTFVNLSGQAVRHIIRDQKIKLKNLLIICDDINLPLGKIRLKGRGSSGGHRGLHSIIQALGTKDFARLRIGVGRPKLKSQKGRLSNYVLGRFTPAEIKAVKEAVAEAADCCQAWASEGIDLAMNRFNSPIQFTLPSVA